MNKYRMKDIIKFSICNKLITRGAIGSSSDKYRNPVILHLPATTIVNSTEYSNTDVVGVSVNGRRYSRVEFDRGLVKQAIVNKATIVKDNAYHTNRSFNIGEQNLTEFLESLGAIMISNTSNRSTWRLV